MQTISQKDELLHDHVTQYLLQNIPTLAQGLKAYSKKDTPETLKKTLKKTFASLIDRSHVFEHKENKMATRITHRIHPQLFLMFDQYPQESQIILLDLIQEESLMQKPLLQERILFIILSTQIWQQIKTTPKNLTMVIKSLMNHTINHHLPMKSYLWTSLEKILTTDKELKKERVDAFLKLPKGDQFFLILLLIKHYHLNPNKNKNIIQQFFPQIHSRVLQCIISQLRCNPSEHSPKGQNTLWKVLGFTLYDAPLTQNELTNIRLFINKSIFHQNEAQWIMHLGKLFIPFQIENPQLKDEFLNSIYQIFTKQEPLYRSVIQYVKKTIGEDLSNDSLEKYVLLKAEQLFSNMNDAGASFLLSKMKTDRNLAVQNPSVYHIMAQRIKHIYQSNSQNPSIFAATIFNSTTQWALKRPPQNNPGVLKLLSHLYISIPSRDRSQVIRICLDQYKRQEHNYAKAYYESLRSIDLDLMTVHSSAPNTLSFKNSILRKSS